MLKSINKKALSLFFVVIALVQFGSTMPMILKLPNDCIGEVFRCLNSKDTLNQRIVCKWFQKVVDNYQCFSFPGKKNPFSCYPYSKTIAGAYGYCHSVSLYNDTVTKAFLKEKLPPSINKNVDSLDVYVKLEINKKPYFVVEEIAKKFQKEHSGIVEIMDNPNKIEQTLCLTLLCYFFNRYETQGGHQANSIKHRFYNYYSNCDLKNHFIECISQNKKQSLRSYATPVFKKGK